MKKAADAGNITFAVSIEGFEQETDARRGKGTFRDNLRAFENMAKYGIVFGTSLTVNKHNAHLILDNDELIKFYFDEQGAAYMWVFQYMPIAESTAYQEIFGILAKWIFRC